MEVDAASGCGSQLPGDDIDGGLFLQQPSGSTGENLPPPMTPVCPLPKPLAIPGPSASLSCCCGCTVAYLNLPGSVLFFTHSLSGLDAMATALVEQRSGLWLPVAVFNDPVNENELYVTPCKLIYIYSPSVFPSLVLPLSGSLTCTTVINMSVVMHAHGE